MKPPTQHQGQLVANAAKVIQKMRETNTTIDMDKAKELTERLGMREDEDMLKPWPDASQVMLPDGRKCWELEIKHHGGSEIQLSYRYSVVVTELVKDYWGRVMGVKVWDTDNYYPTVAFLPVSYSARAEARRAIERGWAYSSTLDDQGNRTMGAQGYLDVYNQVMQLLEQYSKGDKEA